MAVAQAALYILLALVKLLVPATAEIYISGIGWKRKIGSAYGVVRK
jgi:hypothetical protein